MLPVQLFCYHSIGLGWWGVWFKWSSCAVFNALTFVKSPYLLGGFHGISFLSLAAYSFWCILKETVIPRHSMRVCFKDLHLLSGWGCLELSSVPFWCLVYRNFFLGVVSCLRSSLSFGLFTLYFIKFLLDLSLLDCTYAVLYHSICLNNNLYTTLWWIIPNITYMSCNTENFDSLHFCNFSEQVKKRGK